MPTTITTEQARIALAHREYDQHVAETERKMNARGQALKLDPRATDKEALLKLCAADPELQEHVLSMVCWKVWRDENIKNGCVATIKDDGEVRWTLPEYAGKSN
jgi:hypothetical protein